MTDLTPTRTIAAQAFGGNAAPIDEIIAKDYADLIARVEALAEEADLELAKGPIRDEARAKIVADLAVKAATLDKEIEAKRTEEGAPILKAQREINAGFKGIAGDLSAPSGQLRAAITEHHNREESMRKARADAEAAKAREDLEKAEARQAKAKSPDVAAAAAEVAEAARERLAKTENNPLGIGKPLRGGSGSVSVRASWDFKITDLSALDIATLRPFLALPAIEAAIRSYVKIHKGETKIAGVRVFPKQSTTVRR